MVAHGGAWDIPMPVPEICFQNVSPKAMILVKTILIAKSKALILYDMFSELLTAGMLR